MATTEEYKDGGHASYQFSIEYIKPEDIKVKVDGTALTYTATNPPAQTTEYTVNGSNVIFKQASVSGSTTGGVRIYRETELGNSDSVTFQPGSAIRAADLNANHRLIRFSAQEKNQEVTEDDIRDSSITSAKIKDGTIVNADINASAAIDNTKIADGLLKSGLTVNSSNIVDGSIVDADINATANIQGSKLANDSVALTKLGGGALPTDITVSRDNIVNGTIQSADIETGTLDGRYYTETELNAGQLNNLYYTEAELNNGQLDNRYYTETELNNGQLDTIYYTETELNNGQLDTRYYTETELDGGKLDTRYYTETELNPSANAGQNVLDARYYTEAELNAGQLDNRYYTEAEADARFYNLGSAEEIQSGETWTAADNKVATTAAIDLRIIELVDNVGGFVPIANETSFPTENPDINTSGASKGGTIVSVETASTNLTAQSGTTLTIANGRGTGNAVIITGVSATIPSGYGFLVETTAVDHTYAFHRLVPKATEVATVAANAVNIAAAGANVTSIDNFADRYQISTSAPTARPDSSNLALGDLWFDSSSNKVMMVYDASAGDGFSPITPNQSTLTNINIVAGHVTYTEDLGNITDAINTGSGNNSINTVGANIASVNTTAGAIANVNTVATNIANVNTTANSIANVNNVGASIADVNRYANEYVIQGGQPSSPSAGDLWFSTTANILNFYNGTAWVGISPGIAGLINDANPALANHLDCNDKNLTEVATISGNNLQIDFGTLV